jgi:formiminoglutamate deiminase
MATLWCRYAWLGSGAVEAGVVIEVERGEIVSVQTGVAEAAPGDERLDGVTIPGLANAHSHAFQRALRGRTHGGADSFWAWRARMYELAATLEPEGYHALVRATLAEMLEAGITVVGEFHYLHRPPDGGTYDDPNELGRRVLAAAAETGIRVTLLDTCYLDGGVGRDLDVVQRRFADEDAAAWMERVEALADGGSVAARVGAAVHSVRAVRPAAIAEVAAWAAGREAPLHAHVSEQPEENEACLAAYGTTPTGVFAAAGALGPRFTAVHATHLEGEDVTALGESGSHCCLCPTTERDLADGVGNAGGLALAGARLCVGSDSNAVVDLFEEARAVELDERLVLLRRGVHEPTELLRAATAGGYGSLGWPGGGTLEAGAHADLVNVDLDTVRLAGTPAQHLVEGLVYAATAADVRHVMVAGRWVVRDGRHVEIDTVAELQAALAP